MTDKKITQLTALTGANAVAGDQLAIVDVSDTTMSASGTTKKIALSELQAAPLSAGTANGVAYLNGSKVLTTGSALTFDGTNLGIGTSSPTSKLQVVDGDITVTTSGSFSGFNSTRATTPSAIGQQLGRLSFSAYSTGTTYVQGASVQAFSDAAWSSTSAPSYLSFQTTASGSTSLTERMRLDSSGNLGIGTSSPSASAILDAQSTTKGVRMPNMTTTQKNAIASPAAGLMVFDTTLAKLCVYTGAAWQTITSI